jgi:alpha-L-fucosidase
VDVDNGAAIYGTRPWVVHSEAPVDGGHFKKTSGANTTPPPPKATRSLIVMDGRKTVTIASLGTSSPHIKGRVRDVALLGHAGNIAWTQDEHALTITVPDKRPGEHAFAFRVLGVIR